MALPYVSAAWQTDLKTGFPPRDRFYIDFRLVDYPAITDTVTYSDVVSASNRPGEKYVTAGSGHLSYMFHLPTTLTIHIECRANFDYDVAENQWLWSYQYDATHRINIKYDEADDTIEVLYQNGTNARTLKSSALNALTLAAVRSVTACLDLTTGSTAGSALYVNLASVDTTWSGNIDAFAMNMSRMWFGVYQTGSAAATYNNWEISQVRIFPDKVATAAQVATKFSTLLDEEVVWNMQGNSLGQTRCNVTSLVADSGTSRAVSDRDTGSYIANRLSLRLYSRDGEFADDQYAAFDPANSVYNGTSAQAYMRTRCRVSAETWYGTDYEPYFSGRVTGDGFQRSTPIGGVSTVQIDADDQTEELGSCRLRRGRFYEDYKLASDTETESLVHTIARLATKREVYNLLANSRFENATIEDSWYKSGGTWTREADTTLVGSYAGQMVSGASIRTIRQRVSFWGTKKLNIGETYTFSVWLLSAAAAAGTVKLLEQQDDWTNNDDTTTNYNLAGGEAWVKYEVTHTVTTSTSEGLAVNVTVPAGGTVRLKCAMLVQAGRSYEWDVHNNNDGSSGEESADDADSASYDSCGFNVDAVTIVHPWVQLPKGADPWSAIKQIADACAAYRCGFSEAGLFTMWATLADGYADPSSTETLAAGQDISSTLVQQRANKITVRGTYITKAAGGICVWMASQSGAFTLQDGNKIDEDVAAAATWPPPATFGEFVAQYDGQGGRWEPWTGGTFAPGHPGAVFVRDASTRIIGMDGAVVTQEIEGGTANALTVTTLDTTTYSDGAVLLLTNATGAQVTIKDIGIVGNPVYASSGRNGFVHDSFIDYERIAREGEIGFELANDYIVTKDQVENLAEYHWKYNSGSIKHTYRISESGTWHHYVPGLWYTVQIGGVGEPEYIDAVCKLESVETSRSAGDQGSTVLTFREVLQNYTHDSNALARFIASQDYTRYMSNREVVVASSGYVGRADYFCDGTADQVQINKAIVAANAIEGMGAVRLVGSTFYVSAAVEMKSGVVLYLNGCTIEKNCNDYAIEAVGTSGTRLTDVTIIGPGTVTQNSADTDDTELIHIEYCNNLRIYSIKCLNWAYQGISLDNVSGVVDSCFFEVELGREGAIGAFVGAAIYVEASPGFMITNNDIGPIVDGDFNAAGIRIADSSRSVVSNNTIHNISSGLYAYGVDSIGTIYASGNTIYDVVNTNSTNCRGISVSGGTGSQITNNLCYDNGSLIVRGNCNSSTDPCMAGETTTIESGCTFDSSTEQSRSGPRSRKMSKTSAPGTAANVYLCDSTAVNDLHGLVVGTGHTLKGYVYIPSVNGPLASEVSVTHKTSTGGAWASTEIYATTDYYDSWQLVEVTATQGSTVTGYLPVLSIQSAASSSEYIYWDDLALIPNGVHNEYGFNMFNSGTATMVFGNSNQSPFST